MALGTAVEGNAAGLRHTRLRRRVPYPIAALPPELKCDGNVLVFCGEESGWHLGVWSNGAWRAAGDLDAQLEPTHFALASGLENEDGRWRHATPHRRVILSVVGLAGAAFLAMVIIGQVAYGDPWALCAPARDGLAAVVSP